MDDPDALAAVAARLGVPSLLSFLAHPARTRGEIVETGGLVAYGHRVAWHDAAAGLHTVRALIEHLSAQEGPRVGTGDRMGILVTLRALEAMVEKARRDGRRWHLAVSC
jgi:hypothetical protein